MQHKVICVLAIILVLAVSTLVQAQSETCVVKAHERRNCGYPGVTREDCQRKGCCFDDMVAGVPWCYYPVVVNPPEVNHPEVNPTEEECDF